MKNIEQARAILQDAYFALVFNKLDTKHKELKKAIKEAVKALGGNVPKCPDMSHFIGTETQALAFIHNTIFNFKMLGTGWTDEEVEAFYNIPYIALEAISETPSTCKEDTEAKLGVIRTQYSDYDLDEIQKLTLRTLEHELTGRVGKWGKEDKEEVKPNTPTPTPEARTKQEEKNINDFIEALKWLSSKGLNLTVDTLENLAKRQ